MKCWCVVVLLSLLIAATQAIYPPMFLQNIISRGDPGQAAPKVLLDVYMEALCPDCQHFINDQLAPNWDGLKEIMDVRIFPYGNTRESVRADGWYEFECQHGPLECQADAMLACAGKYAPDEHTTVDFFICVESNTTNPIFNGPMCAEKLGLDYSKIDQCAKGDEGMRLVHDAGVVTGALRPKHQYVVWLVVDGVHTDKIQDKVEHDLKNTICEVYTGNPPAACSK